MNEELRFKVQFNKNSVVCLSESNDEEDPDDILSIYYKKQAIENHDEKSYM